MSPVVAMSKPNQWLEIGPLNDIPALGARVVITRRGPIAIFRTRDDQVFALDDHCPHRGGPLSQGIVSGCQVYCPLHDWCIRLDDGCAEAPDEGLVGTYPVRITNDIVYLALKST